MVRVIFFLIVLFGLLPMSAFAQGPYEPVKAMGQMTREGLSIEYIVVGLRTETRAKTIRLIDGTTKTETYNVEVPVFQNRAMLLAKFEVTKLDGTRVPMDTFAAKMKEKTPLLLLMQPGQISKRDRQFYRADLFVAVNLDRGVRRED